MKLHTIKRRYPGVNEFYCISNKYATTTYNKHFCKSTFNESDFFIKIPKNISNRMKELGLIAWIYNIEKSEIHIPTIEDKFKLL